MTLDSTFHMLLQIAVFMGGCCLGSFFNVVVRRLPAKESIVFPGSHCPACNNALAFYDNIPLLSYVALAGKCRHCRAPISIRYPLVEALTGIMALLLFRRYGLQARFFIEFLFVAILIIITFIDLDTYTIPDVFSLSGIVLGLGLSFFTPRLTWLDSLIGIAVGGGFFYLVATAYQAVRHQDGLGGGDIKLLAMIGAFEGWSGVLFTVLAASLIGSVVGAFVMWRSKQGLTAMLPFGPFLALGAVLHLFLGQAFFQWYVQSFF